jgi:hypothetical protein
MRSKQETERSIAAAEAEERAARAAFAAGVGSRTRSGKSNPFGAGFRGAHVRRLVEAAEPNHLVRVKEKITSLEAIAETRDAMLRSQAPGSILGGAP